ncbi:MAG: SDR family NAD(P)-dependent oxidoreductase [Rhodospirillales bacterium]|nr:SDR family NAD(P)-dependent oxidoreductase [Rhodospirillales bacterium]
MDLDGKVAFVTGGSGDIGKAIAQALAGAGSDVVVSYVGDAGRADAAVEAVRKAGRQGHAVQLDQRDPKSIDACVKKVTGQFGRLDILVNNAAWNIGIPFRELDSGSADDIAQMAVAYCRADSVTGQTIVVDGGAPIGMR